jgi:hypothetical protein
MIALKTMALMVAFEAVEREWVCMSGAGDTKYDEA